ncbi:hypothetical protein [Flavobacterium nitratireducens]|uniref:hypothetical protein n=1 Tax=Flavobacterium nitratireducens TaxID=992289 RepID=UPI002415224E|nr:hypothetical protein [Flavobacterium nitratireducens]
MSKEISCSFAAALRDKRKTKRHVPRHIELTAVSMQIETNKIRVIESRDLNKPIVTWSQYKTGTFISSNNIR